MSQVTATDLQNMLLLYQKRAAFWSKDSLTRCEGLVTRDGFELLPEGHRKVERLLEGIEELKKGVPLSRRIGNRFDEGVQEQWYGGQINSHEFRFNSVAIVHGHIRGMKVTAPELALKKYFLFTISSAQKKRDSWTKVIPYAVQIDRFQGTEVICFHSVDKKRFWRMQSKYYDLITSWYASISWWIKGAGRAGIVAKFHSSAFQGLGSGIAAIILPLDPDTTNKTPFPTIQ